MDISKAGFQPKAITLTVLAALLRLVPHPPNFAPVGAVALFGGAKIRGWQAYLIPLLAMAVTDPLRSLLEGGYPAYSWGTVVVYASFLISVFLGRTFLRRSSTPARVAGVTLLGSIQFFAFTNLATWWAMPSLYARTAAGLVECYVAALPFFGRTVLADLFYTAALFSAYALLTRRDTERLPATVA
ncbi:MAG: hypothetical protein JWP08_1353 [Bryobacterales bacterium]|jgi:uncharacterized protein DUF6580|nr:hypothetical protein [Bryobacterales bacterium]